MTIARLIYLQLCLWMPPEHAEIAVKQAAFESGWFKSKAFEQYNNPFGLMWKGEIQCFDDVQEACYQYYKQIYCQYDPCTTPDYWKFIEKLPYCPGCNQYVEKVKSIQLNLKPSYDQSRRLHR